MSKQRKRISNNTRNVTPNVTVTSKAYQKRGVWYQTFVVQGWQENGKWMRKQFKDEDKAKRFRNDKERELTNQGRAERLLSTSLTEAQLEHAESAISALGKDYTLQQAVDFFLQNNRPPDYTLSFNDGMKLYLDDKERDGVRDRTIRQMKGVLRAFSAALKNPLIHEITKQQIERYLGGLKAKDGITKAKRKTWNSHRNEIGQFLQWATLSDLTTHRPWRFNNPVDGIRIYSAKKVAEQRPPIATTSPEQAQRIFSVLMRYRGGSLVKAFALAYFAGIRPDGELSKLAEREKELINLKTGIITIPAEISKTKDTRQVIISDNLKTWLEKYKGRPIIPENYISARVKTRSHFKLKHDETRHSFISYHVALHRSIGDAALQAGNSEAMVKKHYLNLHPQKEGADFFSIVPDMNARKAILDKVNVPTSVNNLKVV